MRNTSKTHASACVCSCIIALTSLHTAQKLLRLTNGLFEPGRRLQGHKERHIALPGAVSTDAPVATRHALVPVVPAVKVNEQLWLGKQFAKLLQADAWDLHRVSGALYHHTLMHVILAKSS